MKLEKGKADYDVRDIGQVWRVILFREDPVTHPGAVSYVLAQISLHDVAIIREKEEAAGIKDLRGTPVYFALNNAVSPMQLMFFPTPDQEMLAEIMFYPPLEKM